MSNVSYWFMGLIALLMLIGITIERGFDKVIKILEEIRDGRRY